MFIIPLDGVGLTASLIALRNQSGVSQDMIEYQLAVVVLTVNGSHHMD